MTSIASTGWQQVQSPLSLLQNQLQSDVSAGTISSGDEQALSNALNDINSALQSQAGGASQGSGPPSPTDMKSKINDLIQSEVSNGKLTQSQASELQNLFSQALPAGGPGGPGGPGGLDQQAQTSSSTSGSSANQLLQDFLQSLQDGQSTSSTYNSTGDTTGQSQIASLLFNYQA